MADLPLATAAELAALPSPWGSLLGALQTLDRLGDARHDHLLAQINQLHTENAELRDELHELSRAFTRHQNTHLLTVVQPPGDSA
jgi:hypothetical protein